MGLDTSHDCWHGSYSAFMRWREKLAEVAGLPPLDLMEGFYGEDYRNPFYWLKQYGGQTAMAERFIEQMPIKWECLKPSPLHILLQHSDSDGEIAVEDCNPIADELEKLLPLLPKGDSGGHIGDYRDKTQAFIDGLRKASAAGEPVKFH